MKIHVHRNGDMLIYRVRKDEYATLNDILKNYLQADETKFNIHVHGYLDMLIYRVR